MVTFLQAAREAVRGAQCQVLAANEYIAGAVGQFNPVTRVTAPIALNAIRRLLGCPPGDDFENPEPSFQGGQCPGVSYTVSIAGPSGGIGPGVADRQGVGPVIGVVGGETSFGVQQLGVAFGGTGNVFGGGGQGSVQPEFLGQWEVVGVVRDDGQPDNCGNGPIEFPPPTNITINRDVTYNIDNGDEVTVTVPFIFAPITANFDGSLRIPVTFDLGGFEFSGDVNLPDFNLTIQPPGVGQGGGEDLTGEGEDGPGESVPPAAPGEKIIGVVVNASQIDSRRVSSYSSPGITPIFVPRLGSIKFAYSIGIATFFSSDIDIKDRRTFIPCPFSQGADAVIASPNLGVDLTFTPIKGFPLATTNDIPAPT